MSLLDFTGDIGGTYGDLLEVEANFEKDPENYSRGIITGTAIISSLNQFKTAQELTEEIIQDTWGSLYGEYPSVHVKVIWGSQIV